METTSTLDIVLALVTILASFGTAVGTFAATRNQVKQVDFDIKKVDKTVAIETAEKINDMTLKYAEKLEQQLQECNKDRRTLDEQLDSVIQNSIEVKIKAHDLVSELRRVIDKHENMCPHECQGYIVVNKMIDEIITEIEKEIK